MIFSKMFISRCKQTDIRPTVLSPVLLLPAINKMACGCLGIDEDPGQGLIAGNKWFAVNNDIGDNYRRCRYTGEQIIAAVADTGN